MFTILLSVAIVACSVDELEKEYNLIMNSHKRQAQQNNDVDLREQKINTLLENCQFSFNAESSRNLHKYFTLFSNAGLVAPHSSIDALEHVFLEKKKRGEKVAHLAQVLQKRLFAARKYDKARRLQSEYSSLQTIPTVKSTSGEGRKLLKYKNKQLHEVDFNFPRGKHIVAVVEKGCHFSDVFQKALNENAMLQSVFKDATFIMPVTGIMEYSGHNYYWTGYTEQWPEIADWGTPTFYVYQDGKLVKQVDGFKVADWL